MKHWPEHFLFLDSPFYYLTHSPLPALFTFYFIWMVHTCLFLLLYSVEQKGDIINDLQWINDPIFRGSFIKQTEVVIMKEKPLNHEGVGGYSWTKRTLSHAPQVSTWEVLLNSLAPKAGQHCPTWWLSISMATHHRGMYPGRVNVFMGQPPSGDDKPELVSWGSTT